MVKKTQANKTRRALMEGHMFLEKVRPLEPDQPMQFSFVTFTEDGGSVKRMTDPVSEEEIRAELRRGGMPESEINSQIERAPVAP